MLSTFDVKIGWNLRRGAVARILAPYFGTLTLDADDSGLRWRHELEGRDVAFVGPILPREGIERVLIELGAHPLHAVFMAEDAAHIIEAKLASVASWIEGGGLDARGERATAADRRRLQRTFALKASATTVEACPVPKRLT